MKNRLTLIGSEQKKAYDKAVNEIKILFGIF